MKKLLIAGAGGFGREVYQWARHMQAVNHLWDSIEFLDDNPHALDAFGPPYKVTGTIGDYFPRPGEWVICAVGDSKIRLRICTALADRGAQFANIIHPSVVAADDCTLGQGIILSPRALISTRVQVGDFVVVNPFSTTGHDAVLERGCTVSAHCNIMGFVHLEEGVFMGGSASILPGVRVGRYAKVGAGAVVVGRVEEGITVFGNPARRISMG